MSISLEVWGDYACFTRPELKTERVSYKVKKCVEKPEEEWIRVENTHEPITS